MKNAPFKISDFLGEFMIGVIGFALLAVPLAYFFGDDVIAFLRPYFG